MGRTVPTSNTVLTKQENNLHGILGGTVPASGTCPTSVPVSRDLENEMLRQDLFGGTVQTNYFPALQDQKEAMSKIEEIMKTTQIVDEEDNLHSVVRQRLLSFEENLQGSVNVYCLKPKNNLCLNELVSKPDMNHDQVLVAGQGERGR